MTTWPCHWNASWSSRRTIAAKGNGESMQVWGGKRRSGGWWPAKITGRKGREYRHIRGLMGEVGWYRYYIYIYWSTYKELSQKLVFSRLLVFWVWGHLQIILSTIKSLPCSHVFWGVRSQPFLPASILAIRDPSLFKRKEVPWKDLPRKDLHVQSALQRGATRGMKGVWTGVSQSEELWSFATLQIQAQKGWWLNSVDDTIWYNLYLRKVFF